jgi:hypothetical protein
MKSLKAIGMFYLIFFLIAFVPMIWASIWFNKGSYSVGTSAFEQTILFTAPLLFAIYRGFKPGVNHYVYACFFLVIFPLEWLNYSERSRDGWLYLLAQLPVIWIFGIYALTSIIKKPTTQA